MVIMAIQGIRLEPLQADYTDDILAVATFYDQRSRFPPLKRVYVAEARDDVRVPGLLDPNPTLFYCVKGQVRLDMASGLSEHTYHLQEGERVIVPRGTFVTPLLEEGTVLVDCSTEPSETRNQFYESKRLRFTPLFNGDLPGFLVADTAKVASFSQDVQLKGHTHSDSTEIDGLVTGMGMLSCVYVHDPADFDGQPVPDDDLMTYSLQWGERRMVPPSIPHALEVGEGSLLVSLSGRAHEQDDETREYHVPFPA